MNCLPIIDAYYFHIYGVLVRQLYCHYMLASSIINGNPPFSFRLVDGHLITFKLLRQILNKEKKFFFLFGIYSIIYSKLMTRNQRNY